MPKRLVITSHRPSAGQELIHTFIEEWYGVYGLYAFSPAGAWPAADAGGLNRAVLDRQAAGLTCCIIDRPRVADLVKLLRKINPSAIVHAPLLGLPASSPPLEDYQAVVNGTLSWLEAARQACPGAPFIYISSTQVYGDRANTIAMKERADRFEFTDPVYVEGLTEAFPIEGSNHSLPGAAAVAADVLAQEFARSFHLPVCCLRVDSFCDPGNGREDRRDILSQIAHCCLTETEYVVHGDRGRQVREIISARDVATLIEAIIQEPRPGEIYNVGGGKPGTCSIHEAMEWIETVAGKPLSRRYSDVPPLGEPRCYYSDPRHLRDHYPKWQVTEPWKELARRVVEAQSARLAG
ncbi:MAG: NAD-dependent epimerase/dehydratase family protein [Methylacidiphilales bacterium]|nr:NAD-dependent epimerase/dehydratase family protein [Candidatus Methylacidiphilales bacterium]